MPFPILHAYAQLMRLDRPIGTFLLLWPTLMAVWLAGDGRPRPNLVVIFVVGAILMRAAGCVINDFADRGFDGRVSRTRDRPLATGRLSAPHALGLFAGLITLAIYLVSHLPPLAIVYAAAALALAVLYPFAKRCMPIPQLILGLAFAMAIPIAYAAGRGAVPLEAWVLFAAQVCWTIAYDTEYAIADRTDDLQLGLQSSAIWFGHYDLVAIALFQIATLILFMALGLARGFAWHFYLAIAIAAVLMLYQCARCRRRVPADCIAAFLNNHWVGAILFSGIVLALLA